MPEKYPPYNSGIADIERMNIRSLRWLPTVSDNHQCKSLCNGFGENLFTVSIQNASTSNGTKTAARVE
jgi:hypothetical protein